MTHEDHRNQTGTGDQSTQVRFLIAGGFAALVNWLVRFPLEMVMPFALAVSSALAVGMTAGFLLYDRWVFPGSVRPLASKARDFIAVNILTQAVMLMVTIGLREVALMAGVPVLPAGAGAHFVGIGAGALVSYLGHRAITFGKSP